MKKIAPDKRKLRGNPSGKKVKPALEGEGDAFAPPKGLTAAERAEWNYAVEFAPIGALSGSDRGTLRLWCVASVIHWRASRALFAKGEKLIVSSSGGDRPNPLITVINTMSKDMLRLAKELGFTPASRHSLGAAGVGAGQRFIEGSIVSFADQRPTFDA